MTTNTKYFDTKEQYLAFIKAWKNAANDDSVHLTAAHFILYNIIRGKDPMTGFSPFQRMSKIVGMGYFNRGYVNALSNLKQLLNPFDYWVKHCDNFLAPFGETFTRKDLQKMDANGMIPDNINVWCDFGKGRMLLDRIRSGEIKSPTTCIELMKCYNNVNKTKEAA